MRRAVYLMIFFSYSSWSQTSRELHSRYGQPDVERFAVRPGITAMVQYGTDASTCQVVIEAQHPLVRREQTIKYLRPETVSGIVDEIVPPSTWGHKLNTLTENMGCAHGETVEYENVVISRDTDQCVPLKAERESIATVTFKRSNCPPPAIVFSKESQSDHR
jgi:hypothetical protein